MITTKQIINSTGYSLPTNWNDLDFNSKKKFCQILKDTYKASKRYNNFKF